MPGLVNALVDCLLIFVVVANKQKTTKKLKEKETDTETDRLTIILHKKLLRNYAKPSESDGLGWILYGCIFFINLFIYFKQRK